MLFCFTNISAKILLHILGYNFCAEYHILGDFCQPLLQFKAWKFFEQKLLYTGAKSVGKIDPNSTG